MYKELQILAGTGNGNREGFVKTCSEIHEWGRVILNSIGVYLNSTY